MNINSLKEQNTLEYPWSSCKSCLFGTYNGKTQIGCKFHRIDKYPENVIEAYDEDREFYVLKGMMCRYKRTSNWQHTQEDFPEQKTKVAKELIKAPLLTDRQVAKKT